MTDIHDILEMQAELQRAYNDGRYLSQLTGDEKMSSIRDNVLALTDELHEALAETGWKPWANSTHLNRDAFKGELVDALHFFMNLMLHAQIGWWDLIDGYVEKNAINRQRQAANYDGVSTKCPVCKRALDDPAVSCTKAGCNADAD